MMIRAVKGLTRRLPIIIPFFWLFVFFLTPFFIVLQISFAEFEYGQPPYVPNFRKVEGLSDFFTQLQMMTLYSYEILLSDNLYWKAFLSSLRIAAVATFFALLIGYPLAYAMSRAPRSWQPILLMAVILPFWTSYLIRIYAWKAILQKNGFLNNVLMELSVITEPLTLLSTPFAVYLGIIYTYLPFMVLPVYSSLEKIDPSYNEAARDLGASGLTAFWRVTVPLSLPGVIAGCFLVFIPAMGEWVIPDLLGGSGTLMIGKQLATELFNNNDWPVAAAVAVCMIMVLIVPIVIFQRAQESDQRRRQEEG